MKANEVPEKIYLTQLMLFATPIIRNSDNEVEYTCTDAFIEKACEFLDGCIPNYINLEHANVDTFMNVDNKRFIEDFRNYMEGK